MLLVTGTFNGKTYEKATPVKSTDLAEYFNLKYPRPDKPVMVKYHPRFLTRDGFGQDRRPASMSIPLVMEVLDSKTGETVKIELSRRSAIGNGARRLQITEDLTTFTVFRGEECVFLQLHPTFENGPMYEPGTTANFVYFDPATEFEKMHKAQARLTAVKNNILNQSVTPWSAVQLRALGMDLRGVSFADAVAEGEIATRYRLAVALDQIGEPFIAQWENPIAVIRGLCRWASDKNVVVQTRDNGPLSWAWATTMDSLAVIQDEFDAFPALVRCVMDDKPIERRLFDAYSKYYAIDTAPSAIDPMQGALLKEPEGATEKSPESLLLDEAEAWRVIAYDPGSGELFLLKPSGDDELLLELPLDTENWKMEAEARLGSKTLNKIKTALKNAKKSE